MLALVWLAWNIGEMAPDQSAKGHTGEIRFDKGSEQFWEIIFWSDGVFGQPVFKV